MRDALEAEIASAEAWEAGASGIEERVESEGTLLLVYTPAAALERVRAALSAVLADEAAVGAPQIVPVVDWSDAWKQGITATVVSDRLLVRPSFVPIDPRPGQCQLVIDPGQAFGTGGHASTLLALRWIDELAHRAAGGRLGSELRVLDVGTGTGVLAMAALGLGAGKAVAFDLDPVALPEARVWAQRNGFAERLRLFAGPIQALGGGAFDLVVANLLRREVLPLVPEIARRLRPRARVVLSGLLACERDAVESAFSEVGIERSEALIERDANGDSWLGLLLERS